MTHNNTLYMTRSAWQVHSVHKDTLHNYDTDTLYNTQWLCDRHTLWQTPAWPWQQGGHRQKVQCTPNIITTSKSSSKLTTQYSHEIQSAGQLLHTAFTRCDSCEWNIIKMINPPNRWSTSRNRPWSQYALCSPGMDSPCWTSPWLPWRHCTAKYRMTDLLSNMDKWTISVKEI